VSKNLPIVDADEPLENEDWILSPEKRAKEVAIFDRLPQPSHGDKPKGKTVPQ